MCKCSLFVAALFGEASWGLGRRGGGGVPLLTHDPAGPGKKKKKKYSSFVHKHM